MRGLNYSVHLRNICLFSITGRLFRLDLSKVWKCFHADVDVGLIVLELSRDVDARCHEFMISNFQSQSVGRKWIRESLGIEWLGSGTLFLPVCWKLLVLNHSSMDWIYLWVMSDQFSHY